MHYSSLLYSSKLEPIRVMEPPLKNPSDVGVLDCSCDSLLVVYLLVYFKLVDVGALSDKHSGLVLGR